MTGRRRGLTGQRLPAERSGEGDNAPVLRRHRNSLASVSDASTAHGRIHQAMTRMCYTCSLYAGLTSILAERRRQRRRSKTLIKPSGVRHDASVLSRLVQR